MSGKIIQWLDQLKTDIVQQLAVRGYAQFNEHPVPFSVTAIKQTLGWEAFFEQFKSKINIVFGWDEFSARPLESWESALNELNALAERFFLADRQRHLRQFIGGSIESLDQSLRGRFDQISFDCTAEDFSAALQPHVVSRRLVSAVEADFISLAEDDQKQRVEDREALASEDELPKWESIIKTRFQEVLRLVRSVPSPLAIYVRMLLVLAVSLFCFGLTEFPYYAQFTARQIDLLKLALAVVVSAVVGFYLYIKARNLKKDLRKAFDQWFNLKRDLYREKHLRLELEVREELFAGLLAYFQWLGQSPTHHHWRPFHEFNSVTEKAASTWPLQRGPLAEIHLHDFLHCYQEQLATALTAWDSLLIQVIARFTECRREFLLPYIPRDQEGVAKLNRLLARQWPGLAGVGNTGHKESLKLLALCMTAPLEALENPALPFLAATRRSETSPEWRGTWQGLPIPDTTIETGSLAGRVVATIAAYLRRNPGAFDRTVTRLLLEDVYGADHWKAIADLQPAVWTQMDNAKQPPLATSPGHPTPLREIWMPGENHFTDSFKEANTPLYNMQCDESIDRPFYGILTLIPALSADEIIYGPGGNERPDNVIGLQLNKQATSEQRDPVLQPLP